MGSVSSSIHAYIASCESQGMSPKTTMGYRSVLEGVFLPWCEEEGIEELGDLDQQAMERYQRSLYERKSQRSPDQGLSRSSIHRYIRVVRQIVNWAQLDGVRPKPPRLGKKHKPVLSREEQQRLEDACRNDRDRLMVALMGRRALRVSELVLLSEDDLVAMGRTYFLRVRGKGAGGNGEERLVPLKPAFYRQLRTYVEHRPDDAPERIFYSDYRPFRPLTSSGVRSLVRVVAAEAKLKKHVHPHLLRHSVITYWRMEKGVPDFQVKHVAGNFTALDDYTHPQNGQSYAFHDALD